ncbi:hypothetical protein AP064_02885 [Candidatus Liberibacter solanacearum]|uniref:hypothetical protein n=1 Tax=Candidatus Liberibacter solanacearum TaxID=556287 RepID=UPI0006DD1173|nr:hypothetical protein [Candidatus Liberibacter solanacearum]KQC49026.1 hypothetical protein AP064_02885 [Candidatus Liberibacter solanacearum]
MPQLLIDLVKMVEWGKIRGKYASGKIANLTPYQKGVKLMLKISLLSICYVIVIILLQRKKWSSLEEWDKVVTIEETYWPDLP